MMCVNEMLKMILSVRSSISLVKSFERYLVLLFMLYTFQFSKFSFSLFSAAAVVTGGGVCVRVWKNGEKYLDSPRTGSKTHDDISC